ncbi:MAG: HAMP domain-containing protein [Gallionellaceae bacterium]|nr:MAG: HAMP domain-containing protein [Gallionellaceae bacterium]
MKYLIIICGFVGVALLYLLSSASANTALFSHHYSSLLVLTGVLALGLSALVGYQLWQLRIKLKERVFGAKLMLRLTLFFSLIAILPGLLMYAVSVQFLGKSIESWFDIRVEKALEGGLNLGRNSLETGLKELGKKGRLLSLILAEQAPERYGATLARLVDKSEAQEAAIFTLDGKLLASVTRNNKAPQSVPDQQMLRETIQQGIYSLVDALPDNHLILRVLVPISGIDPAGERRILQFIQPVSQQFSADAETVQAVYRDYQELTLSRLGLKRLYGITLTLSLLIVLLSAVSAAFFLSGRLSSPLAALAEGTRAVAQGNFSGNYPVQSRDELGALTGLFNQMTAQLADAKKLSEQQQSQVENAKGYLESILTHLSSGVIVVDEQFKLRLVNTSAEQILGTPLRSMSGKALSEIASEHVLLRSFADAVEAAAAESAGNEWRRQIERLSKNGDQMLLLRGTHLTTAVDSGYVIVFDDITHLLQAERQAAWGEVARRLAHEIKNPLTPIQLSAERMQHKLNDKLDEHDAQLLQRATQTIVSQVGAMKNMVADFADYARAPAPKLALLDMHQLLNEVMGLYEANSSPIALELGASHTWLNGDATRLRQVVHNLLHNAHDALQHAEHPQIVLSTTSTPSEFQLTVCDNGSGIQEHVLARIFEPYMTTKTKGTGLGLPIVKKIVEEHGGKIVIENKPSGGTQVKVSLPLAPEMEAA